MGTCYYFWRDDNQTAFELGKSSELHALFEPNRPVILMPEYADTFGDLWALEHVRYYDFTFDESWYREEAAEIIRWSEGQPIEFVDEQDGRIERASIADWDARSRDPSAPVRPYVTGTIYRD